MSPSASPAPSSHAGAVRGRVRASAVRGRARAGRAGRKPQRRRHAETVLRALARSFGLVRRIMAPHIANFGISVSQWTVLRTLQRAEDEGTVGLRLCDLGARLLVQPPSVTGAVDRLKRMGLLATTVSSEDQRVREVRLTRSGRERVAQVLVGQPERLARLLAGLSKPEQEELRRLLDRLTKHLEALVDPCETTEGEDDLAERGP
jgi:DNA-binding MarR family transcriptional regulator